MKQYLFVIIIMGTLVNQTKGQVSLSQAESEMAILATAGSWGELMLRSTDLMTQEPMKPQGYYYSALSMYHQPDFEKSKRLLESVFIFGNESWKEKARALSDKIEMITMRVPKIASITSYAELNAYQWMEIWQLDKSNIAAGINAIDLLIQSNNLKTAVEILDDASFANVPGAKDLRNRLKTDREVSNSDRLARLLEQGEHYLSQQKFAEAKDAFEKAYEIDKSQKVSDKIKTAKDEIAWKKATDENRVEAYEAYVKNSANLTYRSQARIKIIDYIRARIERYASQNDFDEAEANFHKYVSQYSPSRDEVKEFETILCKAYGRQIYALSDSKRREDRQARLDLYYKARQICVLSEADKQEIIKLEKQLK